MRYGYFQKTTIPKAPFGIFYFQAPALQAGMDNWYYYYYYGR